MTSCVNLFVTCDAIFAELSACYELLRTLNNNMYRECLHRNTFYYTLELKVVPVGMHWLQRGGAMWRVMGGDNGNEVTTADIHLLYLGK